jgi:hypothetical protein
MERRLLGSAHALESLSQSATASAEASTAPRRSRIKVTAARAASRFGRLVQKSLDDAVPAPKKRKEIKYDGLYEASRVKKFFEINIFSFPAFQEASRRVSAVLH